MADIEKDDIFQRMLEKFLAKTPEELHEIDENPRYDGGLFDVFQEVSDLLEETEEYQKFLQQEAFELEFCTMEVIETFWYSCNPSESYNTMNSDDGDIEWAAAA